MTTFFVIFFVLVLVNAALLIHSSMFANGAVSRQTKPISAKPEIKIYPIDLLPADYKKAI